MSATYTADARQAVPSRPINAAPDDIAPAVVFFISGGAASITGQTVSVSFGLTTA